jgi:hypothetical protein
MSTITINRCENQNLTDNSTKYIAVDSQTDEYIGASSNIQTIQESLEKSYNDYQTPLYRTIKARFKKFISVWYKDIYFSSSLTEQLNHPAFLMIVDLGYSVIPLILEEIKRNPSHLFVALHRITGENPILPEHKGNFNEIISDWLNWGKRENFIQ